VLAVDEPARNARWPRSRVAPITAAVSEGRLVGASDRARRKVVNKFKMAKHLRSGDIEPPTPEYRAEDGPDPGGALLDGIYVIRTSVPRTLDARLWSPPVEPGLSSRGSGLHQGRRFGPAPEPTTSEDRVRAHVLCACWLATSSAYAGPGPADLHPNEHPRSGPRARDPLQPSATRPPPHDTQGNVAQVSALLEHLAPDPRTHPLRRTRPSYHPERTHPQRRGLRTISPHPTHLK